MLKSKISQFKMNNDGISLVELIVAVAMLAVIMLPFMRTFLMALRVSESSKDYSATTMQVGNVIESVKNANMATLAQDLEATYGALDPVHSDEANGKYVYDNDEQTVVVTVESVSDLTGDEYAFLQSLNATDLSVYTNMDATLVQMAGAEDVVTATGSSTTTTTRVVRDIDIHAYLAMLDDENLTPGTTSKDIERTIDVNLERIGENLKYEVVYKYGWPDSPPEGTDPKTYDWGVGNTDGTLFSGTIPPGSDGIFSLQFVYIPMNVQELSASAPPPSNAETININYENSFNDEVEVRFFLIKQLRTTCAVGCTGVNNPYSSLELAASGFACTKCANKDYEEDDYTLKVNLNGITQGTNPATDTDDVTFQTNVATNLYTGNQISDMSHFSYNGGSLDGMNLVYDNAGDRVSLVTVDIYDAEISEFNASTSTLLSSMQTLKLS